MKCESQVPELELKLKLSPPTDHRTKNVEVSPRSSCVSREESPEGGPGPDGRSCSSTMMLVGCPRCLMYVMLFEDEPKCPKCKSTVLLDFMLHDRFNK
ncbi:hypothetical protein ABFS82_14G230800 [Erythranthe guttata]|uniref:GIR1-like zinc ribbon domain-containing protein n=1 Tax=Erythranthe guttata TaxID=4155 RepID=A0A022RAU5_ERYGU|nr:PREDICTED: uncharacterized protein LOC105958694 [Erythranthe guttata]EYU36045.1 hypothetical protein MIMGU_mgv1a017005mg [Erythranthe guttata]|eukprot:XP_012838157.1 PREDICTED: uncharacterized protein LOC105958694 [Erythranthe guttata]